MKYVSQGRAICGWYLNSWKLLTPFQCNLVVLTKMDDVPAFYRLCKLRHPTTAQE